MCGRTSSSLSAAALTRKTSATTFRNQQAHRPSHNIGPYAKSGLPPVLIADESGNRVLVAMKWGVEVDSSSHATPATFNARAETLSSNNTWKHLVQRKRCVAVVDGFFEWKDKSTPMFARRTDGELMFLAALYDVKTRIPDGNDDDGGGDDDDDDCDARAEVSHSFTIITMRASEEIRFLHDRMPVILNDDQIDRWLGTGSYASVVPLMRAFPAANLEIFQVSTLVNSLKNKGADVIMKASDHKHNSGIAAFFAKASQRKRSRDDDDNDSGGACEEQVSKRRAITLDDDEAAAADTPALVVARASPPPPPPPPPTLGIADAPSALTKIADVSAPITKPFDFAEFVRSSRARSTTTLATV